MPSPDVAGNPETVPSVTRSQGREEWVDVARVLSILLVIQSHVYLQVDLLNKQTDLAAGAVAVFFILAGYFARYRSFSLHFKRLLALACFYLFWSIYALLVETHGKLPDFVTCAICVLKGQVGTMWFLKYLLLGLIALPALVYLSCRVKIGIACLLYAWGCWETSIADLPHVCMNLSLAMSLFLFGNCAGCLPVSRISDILFMRCWRVPLWNCTVLGVSVLVYFFGAAVYEYACPPQQLSVLVLIWAVLAVSRGIGVYLPRVSSYIAKGGAAVIFIFGMHMPTLRMYTSAHLRFTGSFPAPLTDCLIIALLVIGCVCVYRKSIGRNKVVDAFLFGR